MALDSDAQIWGAILIGGAFLVAGFGLADKFEAEADVIRASAQTTDCVVTGEVLDQIKVGDVIEASSGKCVVVSP